MQNQIDLSKTDIKELKAMAYDMLAITENAQNNLKVINQEIAKRNQPAPVQPQVETPKTEEVKEETK